MKYKVKWIEEHMGITRNMIRRYEKKGVISKNENGKDREFDENDLIQLWNIRVMVSLGFSLDDVKEVLCGSNLREVSEKRLRVLKEEYRDLQGKINFLNVVKITGEMPSCFKVSANNFEEIYNRIIFLCNGSYFVFIGDSYCDLDCIRWFGKIDKKDNQKRKRAFGFNHH